MFELIAMSLLGAAYVSASINEAKEKAREAEEERILDLKVKVFRYAVLNKLSYDKVVKDLQDKKLTFEQIDEYLERI